MIINYAECGSERYENAIGVFVAHEDANEVLILSEDNAHSEWNSGNDKLKRRGSEYKGDKIVERVNQSIKRNFINFQKSLKPAIEIDVTSNSFLSKLLSQFLGGGGGNPPPPPGDPAPFERSLLEQSSGKDNLKRWKLKLNSNEDTKSDTLYKLTLYPKISVVGKNRVPVKRKKITIKNINEEILDQGNNPSHEIQIRKDEIFEMIIEYSSVKRHDYKLDVRISGSEITQVLNDE